MKKSILLVILLALVSFSSFAKNTALLIGIGEYRPEVTGWAPIHGNNDVDLLYGKLQDKGFDVTILKDSVATKENITSALAQLVENASKGDLIYVHFSGHGQLMEDYNGDEEEEIDQSFVCYDACISSDFTLDNQSYHGQNHLIDDEMFTYLSPLKEKVGDTGEIIVMFDSCYSGGADRGGLSSSNSEESPVEWVETTRGTNDAFLADDMAKQYLTGLPAPGEYNPGGGSLLVVSACESHRKNYECKDKASGVFYGSLTYCVSTLLDNDTPMSEWEEFFSQKKYRDLQIFRTTQRPVVMSHH